MTIEIEGKEYAIKFGFRVCKALRKEIGTLSLEGDTLVELVFEKGAHLVQTAIKENRHKPFPSLEKIEDYFDDNPGFGTDFLIEAMKEIGVHVTPSRVEELESAAQGN